MNLVLYIYTLVMQIIEIMTNGDTSVRDNAARNGRPRQHETKNTDYLKEYYEARINLSSS